MQGSGYDCCEQGRLDSLLSVQRQQGTTKSEMQQLTSLYSLGTVGVR